MELVLKGTSRVCRRRHGEVGIVEFGLKHAVINERFLPRRSPRVRDIECSV